MVTCSDGIQLLNQEITLRLGVAAIGNIAKAPTPMPCAEGKQPVGQPTSPEDQKIQFPHRTVSRLCIVR